MNNANGTSNVLLSDLYKLKKLKSVWIALIIIFALIFFTYSAYWIGMRTATMVDDPETQAQMLALFDELHSSLLFGTYSIGGIELFIAIVACIFIGKDFSCGAISIQTARGVSRKKTYFSKWLTLVILLVGYICFSLLISGVLFAIDGKSASFEANDFAILMRNFALQILCGIASVSMFTMVAFLTRSSGSAIGTCVGAYIVLNLLIGIITAVVGITGKATSSEWTIFLPLQQSDLAGTNAKLGTTQLVAVIVMPIVYATASTLIGYFTFEKRDIK